MTNEPGYREEEWKYFKLANIKSGICTVCTFRPEFTLVLLAISAVVSLPPVSILICFSTQLKYNVSQRRCSTLLTIINEQINRKRFQYLLFPCFLWMSLQFKATVPCLPYCLCICCSP